MSDEFLRSDVHPARAALAPASAEARGPLRLRMACADALSISEDALLLADDPDELLGLLMRTSVEADERVAVFQPCPEGHLNAVLAVGARYVDCGRDLGWAPRMDALELVVGDGAVGVLIATPNSPIDGGDAGEISARMDAICAGGRVRFLLVDRRHDREVRLSSPTRERVDLVNLPRANGGWVHVLVGVPERMRALAQMRAEFTMEDGDLRAKRHESMPDLVGALKRFDLEAVPCAEGAWVQLPGTPSHMLAERIRGHGFEVRAVQHHTWREGLLVTSLRTGETS